MQIGPVVDDLEEIAILFGGEWSEQHILDDQCTDPRSVGIDRTDPEVGFSAPRSYHFVDATL